MKTGKLKETVAALALMRIGTAADRVRSLQAKGLITTGERGRYGGAVVTNSDRVNALLACVLDPADGETHADTIKRLRRLTLELAYYHPTGQELSAEDNNACARQFVEGLGIRFDNLGTALDGIVQSMRSGIFLQWEDGVDAHVSAEFHDGDRVMLTFDRPSPTNKSAIFAFSPAKKTASKSNPVERYVRLNKTAFEQLAVDETH